MPSGLARAEASDGHAVFHYIRHHVNFRVPLHKAAPGFLDRSQIESSEVIAERNEIVVRQSLSTEYKYRVLQPGSMEAGKIIPVDRSQVDTLDFSAESLLRCKDGES